jgi:2-dehydropantoate 2-reductase
MKIAIFGIGGVGGIIGGVLARNNNDVYFYARGDNLRAIRENGLTVESELLGNFTVRPKLITDNAAEIGIVDVLFITSKGYNLEEVCKTATPMVGENTIVISLLNGVSVSELMEPHLPACKLADGCIYIFCNLEKPGHIFHRIGGRTIFGMKDGSKEPILDELAELLSELGLQTSVSEDILFESWKKYVVMCSNSVIFCFFDAPAGDVMKHENHEDVFRAILNELISVAAAKGVKLPQETEDNCVKTFANLHHDTVSSLYRDLRDGKPSEQTELAHIVGGMVKLGEETKVPTPYHKGVLEKWSKV